MFKNYKIWLAAILLLVVMVACSNNDEDTGEEESAAPEETTEEGTKENGDIPYDPPSMDDLDPEDPMTEAIQYGEELFNETNVALDEHVGNELSCMSCHADGGLSQSSSMVGVTAQFPEFNKRAGKVFTLEDRINGCMVRSMNGKFIDPASEEMSAMVSYLAYISEGIEQGQDVNWRKLNTLAELPEPDVARGEELYETKNCMSCHATDGSGTGANTGPALWGDNSFNDGAGMSRMTKMAGYVQNNMPIGDEYDLTDQEASDLAAFILSHDRPIYDGHDEDWPNGGPSDIINQERRDAIQAGEFDWTDIENVIPGE